MKLSQVQKDWIKRNRDDIDKAEDLRDIYGLLVKDNIMGKRDIKEWKTIMLALTTILKDLLVFKKSSMIPSVFNVETESGLRFFDNLTKDEVLQRIVSLGFTGDQVKNMFKQGEFDSKW